MRFSDNATRVIDLATAIRDYWNTELPKRHPNYPLYLRGGLGAAAGRSRIEEFP